MNINLHISRLVLESAAIEPHQLSTLQLSLETELMKLLTQNGIAPELQNGKIINKIQANPVVIENQNSQFHLGQQIARVVYKGINQ